MSIKKQYKWDAKTMQMVSVNQDKKEVDAPAVHGDEIPPTMSHATDEGLVFTSKSKLFEHYRQHGFECTGGAHLTGKAVGTSLKTFESDAERSRKCEWGMLRVDPDIRATVAETTRKAKWGMAPVTEKDKESWSREERNYQDYMSRQRA